ncbi:hypothetical protein [Anaerotignum propionicum]|uniref:hypothetical protein n=1 Tax=Anaerotignum propionicum TaxID=28446 RepID=UPI00289E897F|nr:hypothetical protein [Anaerotignum propionicum]
MKMVDMLGRKFSKLLVIEYAGVHRSKSGKHHQKQWLCKCDCGNELIVLGSNLRNGHTKTCGNCRKITDCGTHMKYAVKNGREFLFDFCDLQFIKSRFWTVADSGYVETQVMVLLNACTDCY